MSRIISVGMMFWFLAIVLFNEAFKVREDYKMVSGLETEEGHTEVRRNGNNYDYVYYFRLSSHGQLLGVGTHEDLTPILDKNFKGLRVGDTVRVTLDGNWASEGERVNQTVMEIARDGKVIYDAMTMSYWNGRMKFGLGCLAIGAALLLLLTSKRIREL